MTAPVRRIFPAADLDIDRNVRFFWQKEARLGIAFFQAVKLSVDDLAQMPGMGSPVILPQLSDR